MPCAPTAADPGACGGRYHDPQGIYSAPPLEAELHHRGSTTYDGSIPASFGTDLIEVALDADLNGPSLAVTFRSEGARFSVQVWRLAEEEGRIRAVTAQPESPSGDCSVECRVSISGPDLAQVNRLALIVVRLDPREQEDPTGAYHLVVDSGLWRPDGFHVGRFVRKI